MKKITKISAQKRAGYYNIFLDDKYDFSVTERILADFMLAKDQELTDDQIANLKKASANDKAREKALGFLSYQPRSIKEVRDYVIKNDIEPAVADDIIADLQENNYLNDQEYAKMFINNAIHVGSDGPRGVINKLVLKGVKPDVAQNALAEFDLNEFLPVGQKLIKPLVKKTSRLSQREIITKAKQKLMTHGFTNDLITELVNELEFTESEDEALLQQGIKAYKKFRKYSGYEQTSKMKNYLFQHGFSSEQIDRFMREEIISFQEIEQY